MVYIYLKGMKKRAFSILTIIVCLVIVLSSFITTYIRILISGRLPSKNINDVFSQTYETPINLPNETLTSYNDMI